MKRKGFTLVELLAVIAILAILVIVAMPNVLDMFNKAKINSFQSEVQKIMDIAKTNFTNDALVSSGQTVYYSSSDSISLNTKKLDIDGKEKNYFIEMDRNGEFKRVLIYDDNYCYDIYSSGSNSKLNTSKSKLIQNTINKTTVETSDIWESGNDEASITIDSNQYIVKGCEGIVTVDGKNTNVVTIKSGTGTNIGDEICVGNECFYVISSDREKISMLSKYNLNAGGVYEGGTYVEFTSEATGLQNPTMIGHKPGTGRWYGTIVFSDTKYWEGTDTKYVYNSNSRLYPHIENYKNYLNSLGLTTLEARVIKQDELFNVKNHYNNTSPDWLHSSSYWTGMGWDTTVYAMFSRDYYAPRHFDDYAVVGIRPVITIPNFLKK